MGKNGKMEGKTQSQPTVSPTHNRPQILFQKTDRTIITKRSRSLSLLSILYFIFLYSFRLVLQNNFLSAICLFFCSFDPCKQLVYVCVHSKCLCVCVIVDVVGTFKQRQYIFKLLSRILSAAVTACCRYAHLYL